MDDSLELASVGPALKDGDSSPLLFVLKFRLRDKHARELNRQARAVNAVWNYANETQQKEPRYEAGRPIWEAPTFRPGSSHHRLATDRDGSEGWDADHHSRGGR